MSKLRFGLHWKNPHALLDSPPRSMRIQTDPMSEKLRNPDPCNCNATTRIHMHSRMWSNPPKFTLFYVQGQIPSRHNPHPLWLYRLCKRTMGKWKHKIFTSACPRFYVNHDNEQPTMYRTIYTIITNNSRNKSVHTWNYRTCQDLSSYRQKKRRYYFI